MIIYKHQIPCILHRVLERKANQIVHTKVTSLSIRQNPKRPFDTVFKAFLGRYVNTTISMNSRIILYGLQATNSSTLHFVFPSLF